MSRHDNNNVARYMKDIHRKDLLTREEENELARRWVEDRDETAAAELVQRNLRFVVKVAMGYRKYGLPIADLIQEGNLGLIRAVEKFDPDKGTRLISYAVWWIKAYIQSHIIQPWSLVRIGTTQAQRRLFYKLPKALATSPEGESREKRIDRIAEELDARRKDVVLMMNTLRGHDLSLDSPLDEAGGGTTFLDRVQAKTASPEAQTVENQDAAVRRKLLQQAISRLPEREREIIRLRHLGDEPMTLRDVGAAMGLSRERVRQLEAQAMRKLKNIIVPKYSRTRVA